MKLFTVYDSKAESFANPMAHPSVDSFTREITMNLRNPPPQPSAFHQYPADYHLYLIADFNSSTGVVTPLEKPQFLGSAEDFSSPVASAA